MVWLALFVTWSTWLFQDNLLSMVTPEVFGLCSFFESLAVDIIRRLNDVSLVCDPDVFVLV